MNSICPKCGFECHPIQLESFGMCVICTVAGIYGFENRKVHKPKPIVMEEIIEAHQAMQPKTVTLAQLGLTA